MKLNEVIPLEIGIFSNMDSPVWEGRYNSFDMDLEFLTTYGERSVSPLVCYFAKDGTLTTESAKKLAGMIYRKYEENWKRKYAVLDAQYNIIDNYNMVETENIGRDTLEKSIRELMNTNSETSTQLNDLMQLLENDLKNTRIKTGTESLEGNSSQTDNINQTETTTGNTSGTSTDTQEYIDRKDVESRNLTKTGTQTDEVKGTKTDDLTFLNRKDITSSDQSTDLSRSDSLSFKDRRDTTSTEQTTNGTENEGGTVTIKDNGETNRTQNTNAYGFGGASNRGLDAVPVDNSTGNETSSSNKTEDRDITRTSNNTSSATSNLTKSGTETHNISENGTTSENVETTKTGSEKHTVTEDTTTTVTSSETDTGSIENQKIGKEQLTKTEESETSNSTTTSANNTSSGDTSSTTTYDTTDTETNTGTSTTKNTGKIENQKTGSITESTTDNVTGNVTETRELTRAGNIGVTTTTQLLREHVEFWSFNFLNEVYKDVADMLTLKIYS